MGPSPTPDGSTPCRSSATTPCSAAPRSWPVDAALGDTGNFWAPTIYENVPLDARLFNEEPFGPVAGIREFDDLDDAITEANRLSLRVGRLRLHAVARDGGPAHPARRGRHALGEHAGDALGRAALRRPQGSGYGTEGGPEALECYLNTRAVSIMQA